MHIGVKLWAESIVTSIRIRKKRRAERKLAVILFSHSTVGIVIHKWSSDAAVHAPNVAGPLKRPKLALNLLCKKIASSSRHLSAFVQYAERQFASDAIWPPQLPDFSEADSKQALPLDEYNSRPSETGQRVSKPVIAEYISSFLSDSLLNSMTKYIQLLNAFQSFEGGTDI